MLLWITYGSTWTALRGENSFGPSPLSLLWNLILSMWVTYTDISHKLKICESNKTGTHLPLLETNWLKANNVKLEENTKYHVPFSSFCVVADYKTKQYKWESFWSQSQCSSWHPREKGLVQGLGIRLWDTTVVRMAEHRKSSKIC